MTDVDTTQEPHMGYTMTDLARCGGILRFWILGPPEHIPAEDIFPLRQGDRESSAAGNSRPRLGCGATELVNQQ